MTANILDGKALAEEIRGEVAMGVAEMQQKHGITPGLAAVLVGDDPASAIYVRNKRRACDEVGMVSNTILLPTDATNEQVLAQVQALNNDQRFHGILVQLPLPPQVDERLIMESLDPSKDVDGWSKAGPISCPALPRGSSRYCSATATIPPEQMWLSAAAATSSASPWPYC